MVLMVYFAELGSKRSVLHYFSIDSSTCDYLLLDAKVQIRQEGQVTNGSHQL